MIPNERIYLYENNDKVYLDVFLCDESDSYNIKRRPMMLICPGGGYFLCAPIEAEPIARAYMSRGYDAAILYYSVSENGSLLYDEEKEISNPHFEASKAISIIRKNSERWKVNPEEIAIIGFSAGAHVAACAAFLSDDEGVLKALDCESGYNKPNAAVLCYPVLSTTGRARMCSVSKLLGKSATDENMARYSIEKHVSLDSPPTFLFHTANDNVVPVENSIYLAKALSEAGVSFEMHIFPNGRHGASLATEEVTTEPSPYLARWFDWSVKWLEKIFNKNNS